MKPIKLAILTSEKRDHDRAYARPHPEFGTAPEALLQGFTGMPDVEVHIVSCVQQPLAAPKKIAPNIFFHGLLVPKLGWMRTLYSGCIHATRKKLQDIKPDIVHGQGTERDCALSAVLSGFPNVLTIHGNMRLVAKVNQARPFSFLWLAARLERFTLPRTDGVVCITRYTQDAVHNLVPRTWVVPNAVDQGFFLAQPEPNPAKIPVGICVGAICPRKNQNNFIRALDELAKEKKFKVIFAGIPDPDSYGEEFKQLIRERPWCEHVGFLDRENLRALFKTASFLVLPTREDNCPMVVLEAMAAGVPVLASNVGGVPDLVEHEANGLLCDPDKPASFPAAVARLLDDRALAGRLAAEARLRAEQHFHPRVVAQKHLEIYREIIAATKRRG